MRSLSPSTGFDPAPGWRLALPVLVLALAWLLFWYRETATAMVAIWIRSETFTHAFLVPPISLWLVWRRRYQLAAMRPTPAPFMLVPIALASFAWLLGDLAAVNAVTFLALMTMLVLTVPLVVGVQVARAVTFPLAFLYFAVPIGEFALPVMMEWTAEFTIVALRFTGIPVYREGLNFVIPSGNWSVVEACSGVRYLIASAVVGTLYAYLNYSSLKRRLAFVAASLMVPIVANWLRAYMIVMLGHLSENRIAVGVDHLIYGWVFFGVVILLMFAIGSRWSEPDADTVAMPVAGETGTGRRRSPAMLAAVAVAAALIAALPLLWLDASDDSAIASPPPLEMAAPANWTPVQPSTIDWRPAYANALAAWQGEFIREGQTVGVFLAYYRNQDAGHKMVTSTNALIKTTDKQWQKVGESRRQLPLGGGEVLALGNEVRGPRDARLVAWRWYWVDGQLTGSDYTAKFRAAISRLAGRGDDSAVMVLYAPKGEAGEGDAAVAAFARDNHADMVAALERFRNRLSKPNEHRGERGFAG